MLVKFHDVYQRYSEDVYRFALYLSGDASWADDIMQETFVRAWTTPGDVRQGTVKAYLYTIARNLYRTGRVRAARQIELPDFVPDPRPDPATVTCNREELADLFHFLQSLSEIDRAALLMHAQDGMPYAEIATALGLTVATIKVRIHRVRIKMRRHLESKEIGV